MFTDIIWQHQHKLASVSSFCSPLLIRNKTCRCIWPKAHILNKVFVRMDCIEQIKAILERNDYKIYQFTSNWPHQMTVFAHFIVNIYGCIIHQYLLLHQDRLFNKKWQQKWEHHDPKCCPHKITKPACAFSFRILPRH